MKRLSHASKVNSTSSLTAQKTDVGVGHHHLTAGTTTPTTMTTINGGTPRGTMPGKCILFPDKTSSLKSSMYTQQVYFRPDMVGYTYAKDLYIHSFLSHGYGITINFIIDPPMVLVIVYN